MMKHLTLVFSLLLTTSAHAQRAHGTCTVHDQGTHPITTYQYENGRLLLRSGDRFASWTYNDDGTIRTLQLDDERREFAYDNGQLTSVVSWVPTEDGSSEEVWSRHTFRYDPNGRMVSMRLEFDGRTIEEAYQWRGDQFVGKVQRIDGEQTSDLTFHWDSNGRLRSIQAGRDVRHQYDYGRDGRPAALILGDNPATDMRIEYFTDRRGRRVAMRSFSRERDTVGMFATVQYQGTFPDGFICGQVVLPAGSPPVQVSGGWLESVF